MFFFRENEGTPCLMLCYILTFICLGFLVVALLYWILASSFAGLMLAVLFPGLFVGPLLAWLAVGLLDDVARGLDDRAYGARGG